jgi:arginase
MPRPVTLIGAASSIGIKPEDDGTERKLFEAPATLRAAGLAAALRADDMGDVTPEPYRDFVRPAGRPRNEPEIERYSTAIADRVAQALAGGAFPVLVGGDCSIVLGALLGARRSGRGSLGLVYLDAHADFATPQESRTGSAASMCLALAVGRGDTPLARLGGGALVEPERVALVGRRDHGAGWYGHAALEASAILDLDDGLLRGRPIEASVGDVLDRMVGSAADGFWVHVDADVLSPEIMPAVDSPEPGGPNLVEAIALLRPLVRHPLAVGLEVTIYDPSRDPTRSCARTLVELLGAARRDDE